MNPGKILMNTLRRTKAKPAVSVQSDYFEADVTSPASLDSSFLLFMLSPASSSKAVRSLSAFVPHVYGIIWDILTFISSKAGESIPQPVDSFD